LNRIRFHIVALILGLSFAGTAKAQDNIPRESSPDGAKVYIILPKNGEEVASPVTVLFGLKGMGVAPAGIDVANTGHHHLMVDVEELPNLDEPLPSDEHHLHFGGGQTQYDLELSPGTHTLQLVLGDRLHRPHDPPVISDKITITVK
jgi:hypothetical protein